MNREFDIPFDGLSVHVTRRKTARATLRVYPDGRIQLSVPLHWSQQDAQKHLAERQEHLRTMLESVAYSPQHEQEAKAYATLEEGTPVTLWGKPYTITYQHVPSLATAAWRNDEKHQVVLNSPASASLAKRQAAFESILRAELAAKLVTVQHEAEATVGTPRATWGIRRMRSRWGSCRWETKRISINLELALHEPQMLSMVALHESAHLLAHNHGKPFQEIMNRVCPNWRELERELNARGMRLIHWKPVSERKGS
jgi:hypothetical protein